MHYLKVIWTNFTKEEKIGAYFENKLRIVYDDHFKYKLYVWEGTIISLIFDWISKEHDAIRKEYLNLSFDSCQMIIFHS